MTLYKRLDSLSVFLFCKPRCQDYLGRKVDFVITGFSSPPGFYPIYFRCLWSTALANGAILLPPSFTIGMTWTKSRYCIFPTENCLNIAFFHPDFVLFLHFSNFLQDPIFKQRGLRKEGIAFSSTLQKVRHKVSNVCFFVQIWRFKVCFFVQFIAFKVCFFVQ